MTFSSLFDYEESKRVSAGDPGFYSLIMAAMRKADSHNSMLLRRAWPQLWDEMQQRYMAPGGAITEGEIETLNRQRQGDS